jgi:hypothetical protein
MRILAAVPFVLVTLPLSAQRLLSSHTLPFGEGCLVLRAAGDTNGDGEQDFVGLTRDNQPNGTLRSVRIASGETGAPLHVIPQPGLQNERDVLGIGDVNGDGRSDVLLVADTVLRVFSGATGQMLTSLPSGTQSSFRSACAVGDFDGNGTADVAVATYEQSLNASTLRILRGQNLTAIPGLAPFTVPHSEVEVRAMGDLTGDGKQEIACCPDYGSAVVVVNAVSGAVLWSLNPGGNDSNRSVETLDLDGDGKRELFFFRPNVSGPGFTGLFTVHDGATGAQRFERRAAMGGGFAPSVAGLGDLDQDGAQDYAMTVYANGTSSVEARSGTGLRRLWSLPNWPGALGVADVVAIGDIDDDGTLDFAVRRYANAADGWAVVSGRILADTQPQGGACGAGPFFPRLGATRPILGQTLTIAGQDAPNGVGGVLVLSLQPPGPTWLGASSCTAFFDLGGGVALAPLSTPSWSVALPLPLVPQLAGFEIALQAFWSPTAGPLGYDLSNGVWARLGYP